MYGHTSGEEHDDLIVALPALSFAAQDIAKAGYPGRIVFALVYVGEQMVGWSYDGDCSISTYVILIPSFSD